MGESFGRICSGDTIIAVRIGQHPAGSLILPFAKRFARPFSVDHEQTKQVQLSRSNECIYCRPWTSCRVAEKCGWYIYYMYNIPYIVRNTQACQQPQDAVVHSLSTFGEAGKERVQRLGGKLFSRRVGNK